MTQQNDYSLLRQFDLEKAKAGEAICNCQGEARKLIAGPDINECICVEYPNGRLECNYTKYYYLAPLAWVEFKPVYKGDVLYWNTEARKITAAELIGKLVIRGEDNCPYYTSNLTWTPPKRTRQVKLLGWFDGRKMHQVSENAIGQWMEGWQRVPAEDKTIEVEE